MYLIPLGTGLVSGYYTLRSSDEITSFTGAFTLICLLISLFIAPWELQLIIMVLVIAVARYYWQQLKVEQEILPEIPEKITRNSTLPSKISEKSNFDPLLPSIASPTSSLRIYRGVVYQVENNPQASGDIAQQRDLPRSEPPRYLGLPYETAGTPVPPLDQIEDNP
jgi:hypothetical protein